MGVIMHSAVFLGGRVLPNILTLTSVCRIEIGQHLKLEKLTKLLKTKRKGMFSFVTGKTAMSGCVIGNIRIGQKEERI